MNNKPLVSIYFDTNVLERYGTNKDLQNLSEFKLHGINFYKIKNFITEFCIQDYIKLCIPQIVIDEMRIHLINSFKSNEQSLKDKIKEYKDRFGPLLELDYTLTISSFDKYTEFIENSIQSLVYRKEFEVVPYPSNCLDRLINKAINSEKPFTKAKAKKEYSDAGFKDAVLLETINNRCNLKKEIVILFTGDGSDFNIETIENLHILPKLDDVISKLKELYHLDIESEIHSIIGSDYFIARLLETIDAEYDESVTSIEIIDINKADAESDIYDIKQNVVINEVTYTLSYQYDYIAKEFMDIAYSCEED